MAVHSVLFPDGLFPDGLSPDGGPVDIEAGREPACFTDLNLDQIIAKVIAGKEDYQLAPFFYAPLREVDAVNYRQEVFADLERAEVREAVTTFTQQTLVAKYTYRAREMRTETMDSGHYHRARMFLNVAERYCAAVTALVAGLSEAPAGSRGLRGLRDYLSGYVGSEAFAALRAESRQLDDALHEVRYCIVVKGDRVTVGPYSGEVDYSEQVSDTYRRFRQGAATDYCDVRSDWREEDFSELAVLAMVAELYPELFAALDTFCREHADYFDATLARADRELQFYLSYLDYIRPVRAAGLRLSYPRMSAESKAEQVLDTFDLALATQLVGRGERVVGNDITLRGPERILVISGPNNGGKTTLARTVGQLHYLARLGCPVPGRDAHLFLCDRIFTHFEKQEDIATLAGKLQEELDRLHADLALATPASLIVLNEVFNSTTAADAGFLSRKILERVSGLDALGVCVTFLDALSTLNEQTVSMVSQVDPADPVIRTHKVIRTRADGRAYARAIAEKYGLTYERVTAGRVSS